MGIGKGVIVELVQVQVQVPLQGEGGYEHVPLGMGVVLVVLL